MALGFLDFLAGYMDVVTALVILALALVLAKGFKLLLKKCLGRLMAKTGTVLDDIMIRNLGGPVFLIILLAGVYFSLRALNVMAPYLVLMDSAFIILWTVLGAFIVVRVFNGFFEWYTKKTALKKGAKVDKHFLSVMRKVLYLIVFAVALVWMLGALGIEVTTLVATLGIGGLAVALALQPTLSNFFSGAYIIMDRPVKIGDYIELESGEKGYVENISWRSTRIRMLGNNLIIIPNSKLAESKIINYFSPEPEMSVVIPCGVAYGSDLEKVEKVTVDEAKRVLKKVPGTVKEFEPFIRFNEFGESNINFSIILRVQSYVDKYLLTHEFIKALTKRFKKEKIEISWPVRKVYMSKSKS